MYSIEKEFENCPARGWLIIKSYYEWNKKIGEGADTEKTCTVDFSKCFLIFVCASGDGSLTSVHAEKMVDIDKYRKRIDIIVKKLCLTILCISRYTMNFVNII